MTNKNTEYGKESYRRLTTTDEYGVPVIYARNEDVPIVAMKPITSYPWQEIETAQAYEISGTLVDALYNREENISEIIKDAVDKIVEWVGGHAKEQKGKGDTCEFSWIEFWEKCQSVKRVCCGKVEYDTYKK